jgi:hypothetical protein
VTVTAKVTTGPTAISSRWRRKSMRLKKIQVGAWSAKAIGMYAAASVSGSSSLSS